MTIPQLGYKTALWTISAMLTTMASLAFFEQLKIEPSITYGQIGQIGLFVVGAGAAWFKLKGSVDTLRNSVEKQREMHESNIQRLGQIEQLMERTVAIQENQEKRMDQMWSEQQGERHGTWERKGTWDEPSKRGKKRE